MLHFSEAFKKPEDGIVPKPKIIQDSLVDTRSLVYGGTLTVLGFSVVLHLPIFLLVMAMPTIFEVVELYKTKKVKK